MTETERIIVRGIPPSTYQKQVTKAVKYAILSFPFTVNRMNISDLQKRILNIAKGKIAEYLFQWFCLQHQVPAQFTACETPFWQTDNRDFILDGYEWDIKNNFIYSEEVIFNHYIRLPALIPDRHSIDQWGMRNERKIKGSKGARYLFTFMRGARLKDGKRGNYFLNINFSQQQQQMLTVLWKKYQGLPAESKPFNENRFWEKFVATRTDFLTLHDYPTLIITGYAGKKQYPLFKPTGPQNNHAYRHFVSPQWYEKSRHKNSLSWFHGVLWTTIKNRTVPIKYLPSFRSLLNTFPANID